MYLFFKVFFISIYTYQNAEKESYFFDFSVVWRKSIYGFCNHIKLSFPLGRSRSVVADLLASYEKLYQHWRLWSNKLMFKMENQYYTIGPVLLPCRKILNSDFLQSISANYNLPKDNYFIYFCMYSHKNFVVKMHRIYK